MQRLTWPLFASQGRVTRLQEEGTVLGSRTSKGMGERRLSPPGLLNFLYSVFCLSVSLPFSELNSGSQLLQLPGAKSFNLKSHLQSELLGKPSFLMPNLLQTSPPFLCLSFLGFKSSLMPNCPHETLSLISISFSQTFLEHLHQPRLTLIIPASPIIPNR